VRYRVGQHGIHLPKKPPREINIPYKENRIRELVKQKDPDLYARLEKEHKSGNLEKMRKEYTRKIDKEIVSKNKEHGIKENKTAYSKAIDRGGRAIETTKKEFVGKDRKKHYTEYEGTKKATKNYIDDDHKPRIVKKERSKSKSKKYYSDYDEPKDREWKKERHKSEKSFIERGNEEKKKGAKEKYHKSPKDYSKGKRSFDRGEKGIYRPYPSKKAR
jgi:hypothetical protein